jgi:uncharacterized protein (AIM24 family)
MPRQRGGAPPAPAVPDISQVPVPATAGTGSPTNTAVKVEANSAISSAGVATAGISAGPFVNLGAVIENHGGFDILKFNMAPGASVITNQETLSYMDGGLSTNATTGTSGVFGAMFRGIAGASVLQNAVVNPTQNTLKMVLSPLTQGSVVQIDIKPGETWRLADKSFIACTPNLNVSGNINIFSNFRMMFVGENLTYTTISADQGSAGSVWISCYGAVEKHEINMGSGSSVPLFINNGCFLGMIDHDPTHNYWENYVSVGTANGLFNAMFTQLGWVMKIQDSTPSRGPAKCLVLTQSLNPHNLEKYIANIAQKVVEQSKTRQGASFLTSGVGQTAAVAGTAVAVAPSATTPAGQAALAATGTAAGTAAAASTNAAAAAAPTNSATATASAVPEAAATNSAPAAEAAPAPEVTPASNTPPAAGGSRRRRRAKRSATRKA